MNITELMAFGKIETFNLRDIIVKEGDEGDTAYIILQGRVAVLLGSDEDIPYPVNELSQYECFGEMALVDDKVRSATVVALEDETITLEINQSNFYDLISQKLEIGYKIIEGLIRRIQAAVVQIPELKDEITKNYSLDFYYRFIENYTEISFLALVEFNKDKIIEIARDLSGVMRVINNKLKELRT